MKDQNTRSVQMESPPQCARRATRTWCSLLGHLLPSRNMANCPPFPHTFRPAWMAKSSTRFRHGLSPGPSGNAALDEASAGLQTQRDHQENSRT